MASKTPRGDSRSGRCNQHHLRRLRSPALSQRNHQSEPCSWNCSSISLLSRAQEVLRFHPAASFTEREATCDTVIPLATPLVTSSGARVAEIKIHKGTKMAISMIGYNRCVHRLLLQCKRMQLNWCFGDKITQYLGGRRRRAEPAPLAWWSRGSIWRIYWALCQCVSGDK